MAIDAGIYGAAQAPQQPNQLAMLAQAYQIRNLQREGDQADMAAQQQNRLLSLVQDPTFQNLPVQEKAARLQGVGAFKQAGDLVTTNAAANKDQRAADVSSLDMKVKQLDAAANIAATVTDQASYERALPMMQNLGFDTSKFSPQYNPQGVAQFAQSTLAAKDRLQAQTQQNAQAITRQNNIDTNATSRANNADTIANSANTAQMVDSRTREFNATKVEENKLKREQKQDTLDQAKAGQIANFETAIGSLDRLASHPGLKNSVGMMGKLPTIPGGDSANFQAELNTFKAQTFLPMVATLKGMGALSDAEGAKLSAAVGALDPNMGEQAFKDSLTRIRTDLQAAQNRVAGPKAVQQPATSPKLTVGLVQNGYRYKGGNPNDQSSWEAVK